MTKIKFAILFSFITAMISQAVMGGENIKGQPSIEDLVREQAKLINDLKQRVNKLESSKDSGVAALPYNITLENIAPRAMWAERTVIKGDFRYRHEYISDKSSNSIERNRQRIRARIGLYSKVQDDLDVGFRIATSEASTAEEGADPRSTNQTLTNAFSKKSIWLDMAYVDWHPMDIAGLNTEGLHLIAGKMENPFYTAGKEQLIFDSDLTPEGGAVKYEKKFSDLNLKLFGNIGGFWVQERSSDVDTSLWGFQGGFSQKLFADALEITGGLSLYAFGSIEDQRTLYTSTNSSGNTFYYFGAGGAREYQKDYDILNPFVEAKFNVFNMPVSVYGDFARNATPNDNFAGLVGCKINKAKDPNTWEAFYNYREVQPDAVLGAFTDSDFGNGLTGVKGHKFGFKYQLTKNVDIGTTLILSKIDMHAQSRNRVVNRLNLSSNVPFNRWEEYTRWQVDLNVKF